MPLVDSKDAGNIKGKVHSHRFPAANTALPYVNKHDEQLQTVIDFLKNDVITLDLFANGKPVPKDGAAIQRGEDPLIEVVVRTRGVGHHFPAGTIDAFDIWLEVKATDENGKIVFWNGRIAAPDGNGPVDPSAHFYRA